MRTIIINKKDIKKGSGIIQAIVDKLPIQIHIPGYKYCGPGTKLFPNEKDGPEPINRVDAICKTHDYEYARAKSKSDIRQADCKMIDKLTYLKDLTLGEKIGRVISQQGILAKVMLGSGRKKKRKKNGLSRNNRMPKK